MKKVILAAIIALLATSYIVSHSCNIDFLPNLGGGIKGNGNVIKKEMTGLSGFDKVGNGISADMILTQGSEFSVVFEGESNLLDYIDFRLHDNALDINTKSNGKNIYPTETIKIHITMPSLSAIALGGSGDIRATNSFNCDKLKVAIGGSGEVSLSGSANKIELAIGGSGDINFSTMKAQEAKVSIGGSGDCNLQVSDFLEVAIAGSGDVVCKGRPRVKEVIVGSGEVTLTD